MTGLRVLLAPLLLGLLVLLVLWFIDAAKLVRWALLVSAREAKGSAQSDGSDTGS